MLHLSIHTPDCALLARIRDGGLGLMDLSSAAPFTLAKRLNNLTNHEDDAVLQVALASTTIAKLRQRLHDHNPPGPSSELRREQVTSSFHLKGLEMTCENRASRAWIDNPPKNGREGTTLGRCNSARIIYPRKPFRTSRLTSVSVEGAAEKLNP